MKLQKKKEGAIKTTKIIIQEFDFESELYVVLNAIDPKLGKSFAEILLIKKLERLKQIKTQQFFKNKKINQKY